MYPAAYSVVYMALFYIHSKMFAETKNKVLECISIINVS